MTQQFEKSKLAKLVTAVLLTGSIHFAYAQDQSSTDKDPKAKKDDTEVIEVVGIRASLAENLSRKRLSDTFTDAIVAEDIGKLPDENLAETLQRVAGVQIEREDGEGASITIRGIRENRLEVNGRTLISAYGRGSNAGLMNYFPSEIVGSVEVQKVLTADMTDGALGGTVNITTRKPLNKKGLWGGATVKGMLNDLNDDSGYKFNGLISNTFNDDTMGAMIGVVYEDRPITEDRFYSNGDWRSGKPFDKPPADWDESVTNSVPNPYYFMYDLRYQRKQEERKKTAVNAAFQWRPSDMLDINADILYAEYDYDRSRGWIQAVTDTDLDRYVKDSWVITEHDARVAGSLTNSVLSNHEGYQQPQDFLTGGVNAKWYADSGMTVFVEYAFTESNDVGDQQFVQLNKTNVDFSYDLRGVTVPQVSLPDLSDPSGLVAGTLYDNRTIREATEDSFRLDIDIPLNDGIITNIKTGLRYSDVSATRETWGKRGVGPEDDPSGRDFSGAEVTSFTRAGIVTSSVVNSDWAQNAFKYLDMSDILPGADVTLPNKIVVIDTHLIGNGGFGYSDVFYDAPVVSFDEKGAIVDDTIASAYVRFDFEAGEWKGNFGARYAKTTTDVNKYALVDGVLQPYHDKGSYSDFLPSIVAVRNLTDDLLLRLGASKTISRPSTNNYAQADRIVLVADDPETPNTDETENSWASLANADLQPQRGTQYDASLEWYFDKQSALALAVFYKELDNQIIQDSMESTIEGYGDQIFRITTQLNGGGGELKGFEIAYQQHFSDMPYAFMDNMGMSINYTYLDNSTDEIDPRTNKSIGIDGVSTNSVNIQLYYEDEKLSTKLLYNWRDDYYDRLDPITTSTAIHNKGQPSLDAVVRYKIAKGFSAELRAVNLLDSAKEEYAGWEQYVATYAETGTRYTLGVSYRF
ncbi:TonB-dependent receptor [Neptunicella sp. SCSIO 80796]|uniref:TonB-dependent receptor n=1 Tax=Neptunicella plasticusilytica TaxID=3117012 RepID=UPI003A4DDD94